LQLDLNRIKELGASLVAISPETPDNSLSTTQKNELSFEVLSDLGNRVARQFGIVFQLPLDLRPIYAGFGIDLPKANADDTFELPIPATYIIGKDRKILKAYVEVDYTKRLDPEEIITALKKIAPERGVPKVTTISQKDDEKYGTGQNHSEREHKVGAASSTCQR
jgi:peroxiredoxin